MLRDFLGSIRRTTISSGRFASRFYRVGRYGFDLMLWSRLFSRRRGPLPLELPIEVLREKGVNCLPPSLHVSGMEDWSCWDDGFASVYATLFFNLQKPDILSTLRYAHPGPSFQGLYLWDSAFIAQIWKPWDQHVSRDVLQSVIKLRDGDRLQHVVADLKQSPYTQPPLIGWSAAELLRWNSQAIPDEHLKAYWYQPLIRYNRWLYARRQTSRGLFSWAHPYESGVENSPRFSDARESEFIDTRQLSSPDFTSYVILQHDALAMMADRLGDEKDAKRHRASAAHLRERMNEHLWSEEFGLYLDRRNDDALLESQTIASLLPLWAGVPDDRQARRMVRRIMDPNAWNTNIPLPSVARDDPAFEKDMWRGPVWINLAYAVLLGLERYGFRDEVAELTLKLCDGVYRTFANTRHLYEYYDPDAFDIKELNRKKGNRYKYLTLGNKPCQEFAGWTGLVNTLVLEKLVGFRREDGVRLLQPNFPKAAVGLGFNVRIPSEQLALSIDVTSQNQVRATIRRPTGVSVVEIERGDKINIDNVGAEISKKNGRLPTREVQFQFGEMNRAFL